jgi:hypothetical protein
MLIFQNDDIRKDFIRVCWFAKSIGKLDNFLRCIRNLHNKRNGAPCKLHIGYDFADNSFGFCVEGWLVGGIIFHRSSEEWCSHT